MTNTITCTANYLDDLLDTRSTIRKASQILRKGQWRTEERFDENEKAWVTVKTDRQRPIEFDTLVGIGLSGTLLLPMIADRLKCNYLALRKTNDGSHAGGKHQGKLGKKWIFFDDLIASGATLHNAYDKVNAIVEDHNRWESISDVVAKFETEFVGAYLFTSDNGFNLRPAAELMKRYKLKTPEQIAAEKKRKLEEAEAKRKREDEEFAESLRQQSQRERSRASQYIDGCNCTDCREERTAPDSRVKIPRNLFSDFSYQSVQSDWQLRS